MYSRLSLPAHHVVVVVVGLHVMYKLVVVIRFSGDNASLSRLFVNNICISLMFLCLEELFGQVAKACDAVAPTVLRVFAPLKLGCLRCPCISLPEGRD